MQQSDHREFYSGNGSKIHKSLNMDFANNKKVFLQTTNWKRNAGDLHDNARYRINKVNMTIYNLIFNYLLHSVESRR